MIRGFFSRRSSQRIPFQVAIGIQFSFEGQATIIASTTNLSAEGVRFFLPKGTIKLAPEEIIELVFQLPNRGAIIVQGEICYFSNAVDGDLKPVIYYGVKFLNVTPEDEDAIQAFCELQLCDNNEPEVETATTLSQEAISSEIKLEEEFSEIAPENEEESNIDLTNNLEQAIPETRESTNPPEKLDLPPIMPTFTDNENAFHSLSQEIIDQIVQSLHPAHPVEPSIPVVSDLSAASDESSDPIAAVPAIEPTTGSSTVAGLSQNEAILEKIRQLAESINLKFNEELFSANPKSVADLTASVAPTEPAPNSFLSLLSQPVGENETDENHAPDETGDSLMAASLFESPSQSSLIDVLYGGELPQQTAKHKPANHPASLFEHSMTKVMKVIAPEKPIEQMETPTIKLIEQTETPLTVANSTPAIPQPDPAPTGTPIVQEHKLSSEKTKHFFNTANNNSSSVSMDQRMIDQIIQSLTKK